MIKKKRTLLVSCAVILLCFCMIVGGTFALFTDSENAINHLKAGKLDAVLIRTNLEYSVLNNSGKLQTFTNTADVDFSQVTTQNVFGLTDEVKIVPGSYFDADLEIRNNGNVAFDYSVQIKLNDSSNTAISEQLKVTITKADGSVIEKMLSEMANGVEITTGEMLVGGAADAFSVRVDFLNLDTDGSINNAAQEQTAVFDLIVSAVQATD